MGMLNEHTPAKSGTRVSTYARSVFVQHSHRGHPPAQGGGKALKIQGTQAGSCLSKGAPPQNGHTCKHLCPPEPSEVMMACRGNEAERTSRLLVFFRHFGMFFSASFRLAALYCLPKKMQLAGSMRLTSGPLSGIQLCRLRIVLLQVGSGTMRCPTTETQGHFFFFFFSSYSFLIFFFCFLLLISFFSFHFLLFCFLLFPFFPFPFPIAFFSFLSLPCSFPFFFFFSACPSHFRKQNVQSTENGNGQDMHVENASWCQIQGRSP